MISRPRFDTLDALRGVAALIVVFYHVGLFSLIKPLLPMGLFRHGWMAVDFFFMLSGFVIAYAYDTKLKAGLSFRGFMGARLRRLYPLYLCGLTLGVGAYCWSTAYAGQTVDQGTLALIIAMTMCFIPLISNGEFMAFILNGPSWSLSCEMLINAAYAALFPLLTKRVLVIATLLGAVAQLWAVQTWGSFDTGWGTANFLGGVARVLYAFPLGALIYRLYAEGRFEGVRSLPAWVPAAILVGLCAFPPRWNLLIDLLLLVGVLPALLVLGARSGGKPISPSLAKLADVSYPLYATHMPIVTATGLWVHTTGASPWMILAAVPVALAVAIVSQMITAPYSAPPRVAPQLA